jgi:putative transcriptional regulator
MNLNGNLLIAPPAIRDSFWVKTVIMITEHHSSGSIGLMLNKRSSYSIAEIGERLDLELNFPGFVYIGGPVSTSVITILHTNEWQCDNTRRINKQFSLSSSEDMLTKLSNGNTPQKWRLFAGLSGWAPNQLNLEIKGLPPYSHTNSWCTATSNIDLVFDTDNKIQWELSLAQSGTDFAKSILS